jgi:hypothetical protein
MGMGMTMTLMTKTPMKMTTTTTTTTTLMTMDRRPYGDNPRVVGGLPSFASCFPSSLPSLELLSSSSSWHSLRRYLLFWPDAHAAVFAFDYLISLSWRHRNAPRTISARFAFFHPGSLCFVALRVPAPCN